MTEPVDPKRLAAADPASKLGQLMVSATRDIPSEEQLAGLAERLGSALGSPNVGPTPHGTSLLVKLGVTAGLAALIGGGALAVRAHLQPEPSPSASAALPTPAALASSQSLDASLPTPPMAAQPAASSSERAPSPASSSSATQALRPDGVKSAGAASAGLSEPKLLEQARRALTRDPAAALALSNEAALRFPHGVLAQEREVIAIAALRHLNRVAEADRRAAAFNQAFPGSAHQRVVQDSASK